MTADARSCLTWQLACIALGGLTELVIWQYRVKIMTVSHHHGSWQHGSCALVGVLAACYVDYIRSLYHQDYCPKLGFVLTVRFARPGAARDDARSEHSYRLEKTVSEFVQLRTDLASSGSHNWNVGSKERTDSYPAQLRRRFVARALLPVFTLLTASDPWWFIILLICCYIWFRVNSGSTREQWEFGLQKKLEELESVNQSEEGVPGDHSMANVRTRLETVKVAVGTRPLNRTRRWYRERCRRRATGQEQLNVPEPEPEPEPETEGGYGGSAASMHVNRFLNVHRIECHKELAAFEDKPEPEPVPVPVPKPEGSPSEGDPGSRKKNQ
eukprot:COSAG06_NODE_5471_length_3460_cov_2.068134_2_plen_327_part_00